MPGSICSSRIEVKPIRRKLRGALASSMKNTLPGSITTPSASAASASSAASSQGGPSSQQNEDPVMGAARKSGRWRASARASSAPRFWYSCDWRRSSEWWWPSEMNSEKARWM